MTDGLTLTRVFDAPRERVWREWTEPERFADWFGGEGAEVPVASVAMDVREGGAWRATMRYDGVDEIRWHGRFLEVVEPERLVLSFFTGPDDPGEVVTVVLTDLGDGRTQVRLDQRGHMPPEAYADARAGWGRFLDRLAQRLAP